MKIKICKKRKTCGHFLIEKLVQELGGLGNEDGLRKIKSEEDFKAYEQKIENLDRLVRKFEPKVVEFFDAKGFYPCFDPMQICWGRRKHLSCDVDLRKKKAYLKTKLEVEK